MDLLDDVEHELAEMTKDEALAGKVDKERKRRAKEAKPESVWSKAFFYIGLAVLAILGAMGAFESPMAPWNW